MQCVDDACGNTRFVSTWSVAAACAAQESESPSQRWCGRLVNKISFSHGASLDEARSIERGASFAQSGRTVNKRKCEQALTGRKSGHRRTGRVSTLLLRGSSAGVRRRLRGRCAALEPLLVRQSRIRPGCSTARSDRTSKLSVSPCLRCWTGVPSAHRNGRATRCTTVWRSL